MANLPEKPEEEKPDPPLTPPLDDSPPRETKKVGWIEGAILQTTGLPGAAKKTKAEPGDKTLWSYAGMGVQFAGTAVLFAMMGYAIDRQMGWSPWGVVAMTFVGVTGGLYLLIKESLKNDQEAGSPPRRPGSRK